MINTLTSDELDMVLAALRAQSEGQQEAVENCSKRCADNPKRQLYATLLAQAVRRSEYTSAIIAKLAPTRIW